MSALIIRRRYSQKDNSFDKSVELAKAVLISRWIWPVVTDFDNVFEKIPQDSWMLGIQYLDKNSLHDIQLGISGSPNYGERPEDAALRELQEECGVSGPLIFVNKRKQKARTHYLYLLDLSQSKPYKKSIEVAKVDEKEDNKSKKVWIQAYGPREKVHTLLKSLTQLRESSDSPGAVIAMSKLDMVEYLSRVRVTNNRTNWKEPLEVAQTDSS